MTIQDLLLPITGTAGDSNALAAAVALSSHFGAHLSVVEPITVHRALGHDARYAHIRALSGSA